jgi:SAM-dependent methyltransferase
LQFASGVSCFEGLAMTSFSSTLGLAGLHAELRARLTRGGTRAYADTHTVAISLLGDAPPCTILDLGAGRGELSARLRALGHDVTAVELYAEQFAADVPLVRADLNATWPFEDGAFGAAMGIEVFEHLENPRFFFRELARVLRPRGVAVVSTPNLTAWLSRALFLVAGQWDLFFDHPWRLRDPYSSLVQGHITPVPGWLLEHHARDAGFELEARAWSAPWLPGVPWRLNPLPRGPAFGRILLARLRKRS